MNDPRGRAVAALLLFLGTSVADAQESSGPAPSSVVVHSGTIAFVYANHPAGRDTVSRVDTSFSFRKVPNAAFDVGERLVFDVNYGFITAGEAIMHIAAFDTVRGRKCYRVEFSVNSLPSFSWIYRVEDRYRTFIDVETLAPWRFEQRIREGTYRRDFKAEFDQVRNIAITTDSTYSVPEYVHDVMSSFYFVRTIDFTHWKRGDDTVLHNFYRDKSHELKVRFLDRRVLEVNAGTFRTIVIEPLVKEGGLFKSEGRILIWLTDDERKMPIRVHTKVLIGAIDTELRNYSGLAGPVNARIK